jgi:hypothetical protein
MDLLSRRLAVAALLALAAGGCKTKTPRPVAGLHSASAPLFLVARGERKALAVGSQLASDAHVVASGPALLEFFSGGALRFLAQGDELDVGDAAETRLFSPNFSSVLVKGARVLQIPVSRRPIAARYTDTNFTPTIAIHEPGTGDYLKAFFTPHGLDPSGGGPVPEGPRKELPAPPFRPHVPHMHAGDLGPGGPSVEVSGGSVAAETDDFATALLLDGNSYALGGTDRLFVPKGASVSLHWPDASVVSVDGPVEIHLH